MDYGILFPGVRGNSHKRSGSDVMTVAVACNLSEGVVLGVDSAVTIPGPGGGIDKVYENAEKLFQLRNKPIGVATYGLASFRGRAIGSYIREFESKNPNGAISDTTKLEVVAKELMKFFEPMFQEDVVVPLEKQTGKKIQELPQIPIFGLVVGGFSDGAFLSEIWNIQLPYIMGTQDQLVQSRAQGNFGTNWFATFEPIRRYMKGYDPAFVNELIAYTESIRGKAYSPDELGEMQKIMAKHEYLIPYAAMPLEEGVQHTRFLVDLVVNHHRYAVGAPVVGGQVRIGKVTYKGEQFEMIDLE